MGMQCDEVERFIPCFLDDELEADVALEMESHLASCDGCRASLEREGRLRVVLRQASAQVVAPAALRRSVRDAIERERRRSRPMVRAWPAAAAAAILVAFIWKGANGMPASDVDLVTRLHDLPMDVTAADIAPVQDYFNHKLPFAVRLPRIADGAVRSLGGRVMHLKDREAAYVRYVIPQGQVSVVVYENDDDFPEVAPLYRLGNQRMLVTEAHGFTLAKWRSAGLTYSLVTDLPAGELSTLVRSAVW